MGYQECYITSTPKRFEKIVARIRENGKEFYDYHGTWPVEIITFKKDHGPFNKGQRAVYFAGERYLQESPFVGARLLRLSFEEDFPDKDLFNDDGTLNKEIWKRHDAEFDRLMKLKVEKWFTEIINPEGIWEDAGKQLHVIHEKFEW